MAHSGRFIPKNPNEDVSILECCICSKKSSTMKGLGQHVNRTHKISAEEYVEQFFIRPTCQCGKPSKFFSITLGFDTWCSSCETIKRKDSATKMRANLKSNPVKYRAFISKLSDTISWQWANLDQSKRIENSLKANNHKWLGDVHCDDVQEVMKSRNLKAPWTSEDLNIIFGVQNGV